MDNSSFNFNNGNTNVERTTVISIFSVSGGSGKSTIASNLAYELSNLGKKVLLIDTDPHGIESYMFKVDFDEEKSIYRAIINYKENSPDSIFDYIQHTTYDNLDIITNDMDIFQVEQYLTYGMATLF